EAYRLGKAFHRKRRIRLDIPQSRGAGALHCVEQGVGIREFGHDAVERIRLRAARNLPAHRAPPSFADSRASSRISKMEIAGRNPTKSRKRSAKKPMEPASIPRSQNVGQNMPHAEGMKSRCRLVTMIRKRSIHIPTLMTILRMKSSHVLRRARRHHR